MRKPDISIITPSLNQGKFLARTLDSVHQQTHLQIEHWVFDGGSTDETPSILNQYQDKIQFVIEADTGQAQAINKGFKRAQAEIIGWLNSDDLYYPQTLETVIEYFQSHPQVNILYGQAHWIDENDQIIGSYPTQPWNPQHLEQVCYLCQPAVFFRKKIFDQYGYLNENLQFCMDYEFWLRVARGGEAFVYFNQFLAQSRLHPACKTVARKKEASEELGRMLREEIGKSRLALLINRLQSSIQTRGYWATLKAALRKI